jgi:hypothetical protein
MSRTVEAVDRTAGALRGVWDAVRGITYEPLGGRSEITARERAVYARWLESREPRNAYERAAFRSFPHELDAEMDRAEQAAREDEAARAAEEAEREARDWKEAFGRWEAEPDQCAE